MDVVLVTGACGFIASHVVQSLLDTNKYFVVGLDNLNDYYDVNLKNYRLQQLSHSKNFEFIHGDIEDNDLLNLIFMKYKFSKVFNLAARAGVRSSIENPHIYLSTNTHGTLNLLEVMKKFEVRSFVLASTSSLYAGLPMPFSESLEVNTPISPYAASKKSAEMFAYTYHFLFGINVSIVRYFTVFGPAGRPDMSYFRFIQNILNHKPIEVFGNGTQTRDFTYVDDIVKGTILASDQNGYNIFNLGGGKNPVSILKMIELIENKTKCSANVVFKEMNKADMQDTFADTRRAQDELGWTPIFEFEAGLENTIDWHLKNQSWLSKIKL